jgi:CubicO group peptidase (beta-lactamase class C family)
MPLFHQRVARLALFAAALLLSRDSVSAQQLKSDARIVAEVGRYMRAAEKFEKFSGAVLVARNGRPVVSRGFGLANVELGVPNTPATVYRLASLATQFTASAIMLLQQQGRLQISDPFCKYLPACPSAWQPITIRQLLTMTSGIPSVHGVELGPLRGFPLPWDQWLEAAGKKPLEFAPGTGFTYDYPAYYLLGFVIEKISGQTYGDFLATHFFTPLGMTRTGYEDPRRIVRNRATGYRQLPGEPVSNVPYIEVIPLFSAGGVYSTTEDLLRWDQAFHANRILTKTSVESLLTPDRDMLPGKGYASGVWVTERYGRREIANGGNLPGFMSHMASFPTEHITVIVLSNNGRGSSGKICNALSAIIFGQPYETPYERKSVAVSAASLERYVGTYRIALPRLTMTVTLDNGKLWLQRNNEPRTELFPESDAKFFLRVEDVQVAFEQDASGAVTGMTVYQGDSGRYDVLHGELVTPPARP